LNKPQFFIKLTATDGSVAFLFKQGSNEQWSFTMYHIYEQSIVLFNEVAAENIRAQW
jgi:hypothetical protein